MNDRKRRLIFHFYLPENWKEFNMVKIHFACLKHYSEIFTDAIFIISVDDTTNYDLINEFECALLQNFKCPRVTFKVKQNDYNRESKTVYEEVISQLDKLDGLTLFAHSKGLGNELYDGINMYNISRWVTCLYFSTLSRVWEVESKLYDIKGITYGPLKTYSKVIFDNTYNWIYSGTFYWINCQKLHHKLETSNAKPRQFYDRFYSELVLGDIFPFHNAEDWIAIDEATSFNDSFLTGERLDYYTKINEYIKLTFLPSELENFNNFYEKIMKECGVNYQ